MRSISLLLLLTLHQLGHFSDELDMLSSLFTVPTKCKPAQATTKPSCPLCLSHQDPSGLSPTSRLQSAMAQEESLNVPSCPVGYHKDWYLVPFSSKYSLTAQCIHIIQTQTSHKQRSRRYPTMEIHQIYKHSPHSTRHNTRIQTRQKLHLQPVVPNTANLIQIINQKSAIYME